MWVGDISVPSYHHVRTGSSDAHTVFRLSFGPVGRAFRPPVADLRLFNHDPECLSPINRAFKRSILETPPSCFSEHILPAVAQTPPVPGRCDVGVRSMAAGPKDRSPPQILLQVRVLF